MAAVLFVVLRLLGTTFGGVVGSIASAFGGT